MSEITVAVTGLAQLNKALRGVDKDAPKGLRIAFNTVADHVVGRIREEVPAVTGAARRSVRAASTRTSARIRVGGPKAPYFPWLDFGGRGKKPGRPAYREFLRDGRYVFPTLAAERDVIAGMIQEALDDVISDNGLAVS